MLATRLLFILLCVTLLTLPAYAQEQSGVVSWVYDGDTLKLEQLGKVRLLGIDTPESQDSARDNYYMSRYKITRKQLRQIARQAKKFNIEHVKGQRVTLVFDQQRNDKYNRKLAYVYLPDGRMLNRLLVESGLASTFRRYNFSKKDSFLASEEQARNKKLGLWSQ